MTLFVVSIGVIFILSLVLALRSLAQEMNVPEEVKKMQKNPEDKLSGVIIFLKEKIIHYSSQNPEPLSQTRKRATHE